jgi:predicted metalloprotease
MFNQLGECGMTNKRALTKKQRDNQAKYKAMGIAKIERPLRLIRERTNSKSTNEATGVVTFHESNESKHARYAANAGNGELVKRIARS